MADTHTPAGGSGTGGGNLKVDAIKKTASDFLSKMVGVNLDTVVQMGAPKLRKDAERRANAAKLKYPPDHPFRSDAAEIIYNMMTANLKTAIDSLPDGVTKTGLKEVAEYIEAFTQKFCDEEDPTASGAHHKTATTTKVQDDKTLDYVLDVLKKNNELLTAAGPVQFDAAAERIGKKDRVLGDSMKSLLEGTPDVKTPTAVHGPSKSLREHLDEVSGWVGEQATPVRERSITLRSEIAAIDAENERRRAERAAPKHWLRKLVDRVWN